MTNQNGPVKAWCRVCAAVTPCEWRWNSETCADLCCTECHEIHVCVHEFSDCDSQKLAALSRAVMHDQTYHDTLAARVAELERAQARAGEAAYVIDMLTAAGFIDAAKVEQARAIAAWAKPQPAATKEKEDGRDSD